MQLHSARSLAILLAALAAVPAGARADGFSFFDAGSGYSANTAEPEAASQASQPAVAPVAAADPAWTAVVYARRAPALETGTLSNSAGVFAPAGQKPQPVTGAPHAMNGIASYYAEDQLTASGEVFDKTAMTAAHKTLPMGTKVRVTNLDNGRTAIVRINDRGPFVQGRVIDVSEAAADVLGMKGRGVAPVRVDLVQAEK